jgi:hypothetical protein
MHAATEGGRVVLLRFMATNSDWAVLFYRTHFDVFDEVLVSVFQKGYPDGIGYCSSSMECPCIFTSLEGRNLNRKPCTQTVQHRRP